MPRKSKKSNVITEPKYYLFVGTGGSGKTYKSKTILEKDLNEVPKINRYLVSPTAKQTMDKTLLPYFDEDNIEGVFSEEYVLAFVKMVEDERDKIYNEFYYDEDIVEFTKTKKNKKGEPPYEQYLLMCDDCVENLRSGGNKVDGLSSLITKARHYGIHLIFTSQYYNAVSPVIRSNMKYLYFFGVNQKELKKICDEHNIFKKSSDFELYFRYITMEKYSYMIVNNHNATMEILDDNSPTPKDFLKMVRKGEISNDILL